MSKKKLTPGEFALLKEIGYSAMALKLYVKRVNEALA